MIFDYDNERCAFDSPDEAKMFYILTARHINLMSKRYREKNCNYVIVQHMTHHGKTWSTWICEALNIPPYEYEWRKTNEN